MFQEAMKSLIWLFLACSASGDTNALNNAPQIPSTQAIPSDTLITLERTGCFGTCPIYALKISADGVLVFEGKNFVKKTGKVESKITQQQLRQLISAFDKAKYFSLRDKYDGTEDGCPSYWTDSPSAITSININGKSKKISHYYGCRENPPDASFGHVYPRALFELEKRIDEIAGTKRWIE